MATTGKSTLKMAIVEAMVEGNSDDQFAINGAMLATAERLEKKWADKQLWNALFKQLPKNKQLLADLKKAARTFYCDPADRTFGTKLRQALRENELFSTQTAQKAVREYLAILTEELCRADKNFGKIQRSLTKPRIVKVQERVEEEKKVLEPSSSPKTKKRSKTAASLVEEKVAQPSPSLADEKEVQSSSSPKNKKGPQPSPSLVEEKAAQISPATAEEKEAQPSSSSKTRKRSKLASSPAEVEAAQTSSTTTEENGVPVSPSPEEEKETQSSPPLAEGLESQPASVPVEEKGPQPSPSLVEEKGAQLPSAPVGEKSLDQTSPEEKELQAALARFDELPLNKIPPPAPLPKGSRFPTLATNPHFIDREIELKQLANWLKNGKKLVVISQAASVDGTGGVGKTQLATEFASRYGQFFSGGVYHLNFADPALIPFEMAACTEPVDGSPVEVRVKRVLDAWQGETPRLLILENCEDAGLPARWLPSRGGSRAIITSRKSNWDPAEGVEILLLEPLERSRSVALLRGTSKNLSRNDPALNLIAADLKDLPLAVHIAGKFLRNSNMKIRPADILNALQHPRLLKRNWFDIGEPTGSDYDLGVERILKVCLDLSSRDNETDQLAVDLLRWISLFAPGEAIPISLLRKLAGERVNHPRVFEGGLYRLLGFGLVNENKSGQLWMHELIAGFVRRLLPANGSLAEVEETILAAAMHANQEKSSDEMQPLLVHLKYITDRALAEKVDELAAQLSNELGYYLDKSADFSGAKWYYEKALKINKLRLGEADPHTAICLNNLGHLYDEMGDYATARWYYEQALEIRRRLLGEENPDTARSLNNLGCLLQEMGDYQNAQAYYEQALAIRRKVLGEEHPDTATSLNNLGRLAQVMGDKAGARQYYKQALAIRKDVLGKKHPDTATSLNDLGHLLQISGEYKSAKLQIEQAMAIRKEVLGNEHPDTARSLHNLGELKQACGDYEGAKVCHEQALAIRRKVLGDDHPDTAASLVNLASLSQLSGDYDKARQYYEQSLAVRKKTLGEEHAEVASTHEGLGIVLQAGGDNAAARNHYEEAQAIRSKLFIKNRLVKKTALTQNGRRLVTGLFIFAFALFGLSLLTPGQTPITLNWHLANAGSINLLQPLSIFARPTATPTQTASFTPSLTPTPSASATNTRRPPTLYIRPTSTPQPVIVEPTATRTIINIPPTNTTRPTDIPNPPSPTPRIVIDTPVPVPPTDVPTPWVPTAPQGLPTPWATTQP